MALDDANERKGALIVPYIEDHEVANVELGLPRDPRDCKRICDDDDAVSDACDAPGEGERPPLGERKIAREKRAIDGGRGVIFACGHVLNR